MVGTWLQWLCYCKFLNNNKKFVLEPFFRTIVLFRTIVFEKMFFEFRKISDLLISASFILVHIIGNTFSCQFFQSSLHHPQVTTSEKLNKTKALSSRHSQHLKRNKIQKHHPANFFLTTHTAPPVSPQIITRASTWHTPYPPAHVPQRPPCREITQRRLISPAPPEKKYTHISRRKRNPTKKTGRRCTHGGISCSRAFLINTHGHSSVLRTKRASKVERADPWKKKLTKPAYLSKLVSAIKKKRPRILLPRGTNPFRFDLTFSFQFPLLRFFPLSSPLPAVRSIFCSD